MTDTIELNGRTYRVTIEHDDTMGAPWEEHDGHGVVSDWTSRDKTPGEVEIASDRSSKRFYDIAETTAIAKRDGWGLGADDLAAFEARIGRKATRKMVVAEAVRRDCEHLRAWCNDGWHWCGVIVERLDDEGDETGETASLWGIESDAGDYLDEVAQELAEELDEAHAATLDKQATCAARRIEHDRPDMYAKGV